VWFESKTGRRIKIAPPRGDVHHATHKDAATRTETLLRTLPNQKAAAFASLIRNLQICVLKE
jgi:hypothetical protein